MAETVTIKLRKPLRSPEGDVTRIVLREPRYSDYLTYGDPYTIAGTRDGANFMVESPEAIANYVHVCLVEPKDPAILEQGNARLARDVKEAILGFFRPDDPANEASATSQTNSPSETSGGTASPTSNS
jgi:hypothetical protein